MILHTKHLTKLFRQKDAIEGAILSRLRTASQTQKDLDYINKNVMVNPPVGATVLSYFRAKAKSMNDKALRLIDREELVFVAERTGTYKKQVEYGGKKKYVVQGQYAEILRLKIGCRVIIKSNGDCSLDGCKIPYHNGDSGVFYAIDNQERLYIERTDGQTIRLARDKIGDVQDKKVKEMVTEIDDETGEEVTFQQTKLIQITKGQFKQYPITLGYAQTGHSSQGLTLKKIHVELPPSGPPPSLNWIYVVFSRVESIKNLTLSRPLTMLDVQVIDGLKDKGDQQYEL